MKAGQYLDGRLPRKKERKKKTTVGISVDHTLHIKLPCELVLKQHCSILSGWLVLGILLKTEGELNNWILDLDFHLHS